MRVSQSSLAHLFPHTHLKSPPRAGWTTSYWDGLVKTYGDSVCPRVCVCVCVCVCVRVRVRVRARPSAPHSVIFAHTHLRRGSYAGYGASYAASIPINGALSLVCSVWMAYALTLVITGCANFFLFQRLLGGSKSSAVNSSAETLTDGLQETILDPA